MSEDSSRRKKNNPSRVLQTTEDGVEEEHNEQFQENDGDVIDIPDEDTTNNIDSKGWFQASGGEMASNQDGVSEDGGRGFVFSASAADGNDADMVVTEIETVEDEDNMDGESQGRRPAHSILHGSRTLRNRRQIANSFNRPRQFMGVNYDSDQQGYSMDPDTNQVRRQQRAVEPFVCRTTSNAGKKDASMQFPDDELAVLREENDALRKENSELRKKVDRLVDTIALNDALPSLLATLRGGPPSLGESSHSQSSAPDDHSTTTLECMTSCPSTSSTPSTITISKCHSLANDEPTATTSAPQSSSLSSSSSAQDAIATVSGIGQMQAPADALSPTLSQVVAAVDRSSTLPQIPLSQVSLPQLAAAMDHELLPHISQQHVQIPRAPVLPVLAPSIQMGLTGQPPMVPPGAPSQLAMMHHSLPSQIPHSASQTVLHHISHMAPSSLAPVRIRGKIMPRQGGKQNSEDMVEISLSNRVKVDKRLLDRCNHTNFRKLTSDLLMCLFPRKVLSRSTLGGTSNTISRTTGLPTNKTRLDPEKVEAILDYVGRVTGVPARAVKDAIRTKLNNEAKRMHRQLIFKR